jgi:hypothetical protein
MGPGDHELLGCQLLGISVVMVLRFMFALLVMHVMR